MKTCVSCGTKVKNFPIKNVRGCQDCVDKGTENFLRFLATAPVVAAESMKKLLAVINKW